MFRFQGSITYLQIRELRRLYFWKSQRSLAAVSLRVEDYMYTLSLSIHRSFDTDTEFNPHLRLGT